MGWDLVSTNSAGYKKFRDSNGNLRYQKPDGTFTSSNAWSGSFSQEGVEEIPENEEEYEGGILEKDVWVKKVTENPELYKDYTRFILDEPYDRKGIAPVDNPFPSRGYLLDNYPTEERLDMLEEKFRDTSFESYAFGVYSIMVEDNTIVSSGERFTEHNSNLTILKSNFRQVLTEIGNALNSSPGTTVIITKTFLAGFNYEQ